MARDTSGIELNGDGSHRPVAVAYDAAAATAASYVAPAQPRWGTLRTRDFGHAYSANQYIDDLEQHINKLNAWLNAQNILKRA